MITEEQYYNVQSILDGRNRNKEALSQYKVKDHPIFPLRSIARCGKCGAALTGGFSRGTGGRYPYYRCRLSCGEKSIKVNVLENALLDLLKKITPREECQKLFITFILDTYHKRLSRLQKLRNHADTEITKLHELRRQLVEKNLKGIYSDEIFKEQNVIIEDKLFKANIAKHDEMFENYDMNKIIDFIKIMLADLAKFYTQSDLNQKKVFLSSIFPSGIAWDYNGRLNCEFSPAYQSVYHFDSQVVNSGAGERT